MLQQTTVAAVRPRFERFLERWPTVQALAAAPQADVMAEWAGLGYYARARNLHACAKAVAAGGWPCSEASLRTLPGLGDYTAAAVAAIAFGQAAVPIDANIRRVASRLFASAEPAPKLKARLSEWLPHDRPGDFAQALMDLGSAVCTPRAPGCLACPLADNCAAHAMGTVDQFPPRKAKRARPLKRGVAFWLERDGHVLTVTRPPKGMLGGMRALPSSPWEAGLPDTAALAAAPAQAEWRLLPQPVAHGFTHFDLELSVAVAHVSPPGQGGGGGGSNLAASSKLRAGRTHRPTPTPSLPGMGAGSDDWLPIAELANAGLPTLFAKAARLAMAAR